MQVRGTNVGDALILKNGASNMMQQICPCDILPLLLLTTVIVEVSQPTQSYMGTTTLLELRRSPRPVNAQKIHDNFQSSIEV